jgi:hypothetical protein
MKNLFALSFVVAVVSLSSCAKDYSCECTDANGTKTTTTIHSSKKKAKTACAVFAIGGETCSIK